MGEPHTLIHAFATGDSLFIRQSLNRIPIFAEFFTLFDYEQFQQLLSYIRMQTINSTSILQLKTGNIYYLLDNQMRVNMDNIKEIMTNSMNRKRRRSSGLHCNGIVGESTKAGQILGFNQLFDEEKEQFAIGFISNGHKSNIIVFQYSTLITSNKLKLYIQDKIKFLSKFETFKVIPKHILQQNLHKFEMLKLSFNQLLFNYRIRSSINFFLYKGEIQIKNYCNVANQNIIIRSCNQCPQQSFYIPSELSYCNNPNENGPQKRGGEVEKAICKSDECILFCIQKQHLDSLIEKFRYHQQNCDNVYKKREQLSIVKQVKNNMVGNQLRSSFNNFCSSSPVSPLVEPKSINKITMERRNKYKSDIRRISSPKKQKLRQYFSDYLNQQFENFSQVKMKEINPDFEYPILYKIKSLHPTIPSYEEINEKLKKIRIRKIYEQKANQLQFHDKLLLNNFGGFNQVSKQNYQISNKINRSLENRMRIIRRKRIMI